MTEGMKNNEYIKELMKKNKITQWELAARFQVHENTVQRTLRRELPENMYEMYMGAIEKILELRKGKA